MDHENLAACERALEYEFHEIDLLARALTHPSRKGPDIPCNQRLEFLGDAVLGAIVAEHLYRRFPGFTEGQLTKVKSVVVSSRTLGKLSRRLGIDRFVVVGKGVSAEPGLPSSILADVFESLLGAIFLDGGLGAARRFVLAHVAGEIDRVLQNRHPRNYKSLLQHLAQRRFTEVPVYCVLEERGPDHAKDFRVAATIDGRTLGEAWGKSKKVAEQIAAKEAFERLRAEGGRPDPAPPENPATDADGGTPGGPASRRATAGAEDPAG